MARRRPGFFDVSPVVVSTKSLQIKLKQEYVDLVSEDNGLIAKFPDRFPAEHFTEENWVWAFTMLFSHAICLHNLQVGERLAMVHYADLINHSAFLQTFIKGFALQGWIQGYDSYAD